MSTNRILDEHMILIGHFVVGRMHRSGKLVEMLRPMAPHAPRRNQKVYYSRWDFSGETGASSGPSWWLENKSEARGWAFVVAGGSALGLFASLDLRTHAKGGSQSTF